MDSELEALAVLAHVDAELEKNANIFGRSMAAVKGFARGFSRAGQAQSQQMAINKNLATLGQEPAHNVPGMLGRFEQRYQAGKERAGASVGLYNQRKLQTIQEGAHQNLKALGHEGPGYTGPDYRNMSVGQFHAQTNPSAPQNLAFGAGAPNAQGAAGTAQNAQGAAGTAQSQQAPNNSQGWGRWALPAAGGLAIAGGAYLLGRGSQRDSRDDYPPRPYGPGRYGYAEEAGAEKAASVAGLAAHAVAGGLGGHVALNAANLSAHGQSNINDVLAHRGLQAGLQGLELHPTRRSALGATMGYELIAPFLAGQLLGKKLSGLSPEGRQLALMALSKGHGALGITPDTPYLSNLQTAITHTLAGTAPTRQAKGVRGRLQARALDDLTQHLTDPKKDLEDKLLQRNIFRRAFGHIRGALPALGLAAVDIPLGGGLGALGHMSINEARREIAGTQYGKNVQKDLLYKGLTNEPISKTRRLLGQLGLSPAFFDPYDLGTELRRSDAAIPAVGLAAHERAMREKNRLSNPVMQAAMSDEPLRGGARSSAASLAFGNQAKPAPPGPSRMQGALNFAKKGLPVAFGLGALGLLGREALKGSDAADEQNARTQDYLTHARHNMGTPLPGMTVTASYDLFAEEKLANTNSYSFSPVFPSAQQAVASSVAQQLAQKFVGEPIDAAHKALTKKLYDEPKQQHAFDEAVASDDMLREVNQQNPRALQESFSTLKTFAPSVAKNPSATRSFLRQSAMTGMHGSGPDFATIRLLAETEKFIQNSKGRGMP